MKAKIKPIETIYNGYKFRSRLEARWAVFFDKMHIRYEYELEGFELPNGKMYLPDFYLPSLDMFVDIKPSFQKMTIDDIRKIECFGEEMRLLLIIGTPSKEEMYYLSNCVYNGQIDELMSEEIYNSPCNAIEEAYSFNEVEFSSGVFDTDWTLCAKDKRYPPEEAEFNEAIRRAKQMQFEFTEK